MLHSGQGHEVGRAVGDGTGILGQHQGPQILHLLEICWNNSAIERINIDLRQLASFSTLAKQDWRVEFFFDDQAMMVFGMAGLEQALCSELAGLGGRHSAARRR